MESKRISDGARMFMLSMAVSITLFGMLGCQLAQEPTPTPIKVTPSPTVNPLLGLFEEYGVDFASIDGFFAEHDFIITSARQTLQTISINRLSGSEWLKPVVPSISNYGTGITFEQIKRLYEEAQLRSDVQEHLLAERELLRLLLEAIDSDMQSLGLVTWRYPGIPTDVIDSSPFLKQQQKGLSNFYQTARSAMAAEKSALEDLLRFYESEDFITKGKNADQFELAFIESADQLSVALVRWEIAKTLFQAIPKKP